MNTKRILSVIAVALITFTTATAQRISVVTENGTTSVHRTLQQAIEGADPGSTIYLPGGGFSIADSVKITKRLTIIGIGHKSDNENADGSTIIAGNLFFNEGSSGSAIMSCYITGNVNIGEGGATVNDVTIKFCNLNSVQVKNRTCQETVIGQNYVRDGCQFNYSNAYITNNILKGFYTLENGIVNNNIFLGGVWTSASGYSNGSYAFVHSNNCIMNNNIFVARAWGGNNTAYNNMGKEDYGDGFTNIGDVAWNDVFDNFNNGAISPVSKFHFKGDYTQYEHQVGIYVGDSFNEDQLAPVPYIISKDIPQQTDAAGNLNIKIRVKAGD